MDTMDRLQKRKVKLKLLRKNQSRQRKVIRKVKLQKGINDKAINILDKLHNFKKITMKPSSKSSIDSSEKWSENAKAKARRLFNVLSELP